MILRTRSSHHETAHDAPRRTALCRCGYLNRLALSLGVFCLLSWCGVSTMATESTDKAAEPTTALILVVGAPGTEEYGQQFQDAAGLWEQLADQQGWQTIRIEQSSESLGSSKEQLQASIERHANTPYLWIVLLGHGTFSRNRGKFNLIGSDVSSDELADWLSSASGQVVSVNCFSSSAPFLLKLSGRNRIVISATRSSGEYNFSRFGRFLAESIGDLSVDLDHDASVSLLEAFLAASNRTARFYKEQARLATEHALLDDNGDRVGTSAEFYRGVLPAREAQGELDGRRASRVILATGGNHVKFSDALASARELLEEQLDQLRRQKSNLPTEDYYQRLEPLMLELAELYDQAEAEASHPDAPSEPASHSANASAAAADGASLPVAEDKNPEK